MCNEAMIRLSRMILRSLPVQLVPMEGRAVMSRRYSFGIAVGLLAMGAMACTGASTSDGSASDALRSYCSAVDIAGAALGEFQSEFNRKNGDPEAPAHNLASVYADQVDDATRDLSLQDEWTVVVTNQTNTQLWRVYARRLERDPQDKSSLVTLSALVGHAQGACDTWRNFNQIPKDR